MFSNPLLKPFKLPQMKLPSFLNKDRLLAAIGAGVLLGILCLVLTTAPSPSKAWDVFPFKETEPAVLPTKEEVELKGNFEVPTALPSLPEVSVVGKPDLRFECPEDLMPLFDPELGHVGCILPPT